MACHERLDGAIATDSSLRSGSANHYPNHSDHPANTGSNNSHHSGNSNYTSTGKATAASGCNYER
jgi:hypothetical protein